MQSFPAWHLLVTASLWISCYPPVRVKSSTSHSSRLALFIMTEAWLLTRYKSAGSTTAAEGLTARQTDRWTERGVLAVFTTETLLPHLSNSRQKHTASFTDRQALCTVNLAQLATQAECRGGRISILETTPSSSMFCIDENTGGKRFPGSDHKQWHHLRDILYLLGVRSKRLDRLLTGGTRCQSDAAVDWVGGRPSGAPWERRDNRREFPFIQRPLATASQWEITCC